MRNAGGIATVFEAKFAESRRLSPFCNSEKNCKIAALRWEDGAHGKIDWPLICE
jgi:hypothetical protein